MREEHYQEKSIHYGIGQTRRRKILELFGSAAGVRVLDVGCSTGYLGLKIKNQGNYVAGVEIAQSAADEARKVLDQVYVIDLEHNWPEELSKQDFDFVVIAEVVEHVFDPVQVLKKVRTALRPGGQLIVTTPNIMTWTNRIKFLFGQWKYTDQGMLDFGHIRLFTYAYLKEVLSESGFVLVQENHIIFPGKLTRVLKFWPSLFANQFIVKAKKI